MKDESTSSRSARQIEAGGAIAVYGVPRTVGKLCTLYLFSDVLCWCTNSKDGDGGSVELIKAFGGLGSADQSGSSGVLGNSAGLDGGRVSYTAEMLPVVLSDRSSGDAPSSIMRVCDGTGVLYVRGPTAEIAAWVEAIQSMP
ncbi:hypothetical protein BC831DRAFT_396545 [Entophlyctis helioformis]|nr:hypothetical protein BC831DRAFT_396545 [Entophlyctis helioformis]